MKINLKNGEGLTIVFSDGKTKSLGYFQLRELCRVDDLFEKELHGDDEEDHPTSVSKPAEMVNHGAVVLSYAEEKDILAGYTGDAIKSISDRTGISIVEANKIVQNFLTKSQRPQGIPQMVQTILRKSKEPYCIPAVITDEIELIKADKFITAVKNIRERTGCSLRDAKMAAELVVKHLEKNQ
ncbi:MAG: hypothetical protein MN733_13565 [Nitrososphaera sp.]|nr:hypothetical protein [Nitrososphaera sp.]